MNSFTRIATISILLFNCFFAFGQNTEFDALIALYNSTDGPNWTDNNGWVDGVSGTNTDYCNWEGVSCNANNEVVSISLWAMG